MTRDVLSYLYNTHTYIHTYINTYIHTGKMDTVRMHMTRDVFCRLFTRHGASAHRVPLLTPKNKHICNVSLCMCCVCCVYVCVCGGGGACIGTPCALTHAHKQTYMQRELVCVLCVCARVHACVHRHTVCPYSRLKTNIYAT
jgi:hypothetical protein